MTTANQKVLGVVGLGSMGERTDELGGTFEVITRPEFEGTRISARLPA